MKKIIVAIDGLSSCGKSTMAKELARRIGYKYIDTGAMYRAITLFALRNKLFSDNGKPDIETLRKHMINISVCFDVNNISGRSETYLNGENVEKYIRTMEVSKHVSAISSIPFIRESLVCQQRLIGEKKGLVMDGRDIGTVVFPNAELKVFVTASPEIRAKRRLAEMSAKGENALFEDILSNVKSRDYQDINRSISPLRRADDAIVLDNSDMTQQEQNELLYSWFCDKVQNCSKDRNNLNVLTNND